MLQVVPFVKSLTEMENVVLVREKAIQPFCRLVIHFQDNEETYKTLLDLAPGLSQDTEASVRKKMAEYMGLLINSLINPDDQAKLAKELEQLVVDEDVTVKATALEVGINNWEKLQRFHSCDLIEEDLVRTVNKCEIPRDHCFTNTATNDSTNNNQLFSSAPSPERRRRLSSSSTMSGDFATAVAIGIDGNLRVGDEKQELLTISLADLSAKAFFVFNRYGNTTKNPIKALCSFLYSLTYHPAASVRRIITKQVILCAIGLNDPEYLMLLKPSLERLSSDPAVEIREKICLTLPMLIDPLSSKTGSGKYYLDVLKKCLLDSNGSVQRNALIGTCQWVLKLSILNRLENNPSNQRSLIETIWQQSKEKKVQYDQRVQASFLVASRQIPFLYDHPHATSVAIAINLNFLGHCGAAVRRMACHSLVWLSRWASRSAVRNALNNFLCNSLSSSKVLNIRRLAVDAIVAACWIFSKDYVTLNYFPSLTTALQDSSSDVRIYALRSIPGILHHLDVSTDDRFMNLFSSIYRCYKFSELEREKDVAASLLRLLMNIPGLTDAFQSFWAKLDHTAAEMSGPISSKSVTEDDGEETKSCGSQPSLQGSNAEEGDKESDMDQKGNDKGYFEPPMDTESKKSKLCSRSHSFRKGRSTLRRKGIALHSECKSEKWGPLSSSSKGSPRQNDLEEDLTEQQRLALDLPEKLAGDNAVSFSRKIDWYVTAGELKFELRSNLYNSKELLSDCKCSRRSSEVRLQTFQQVVDYTVLLMRSSELYVDHLLDVSPGTESCVFNPFVLPRSSLSTLNEKVLGKSDDDAQTGLTAKWEALESIFQETSTTEDIERLAVVCHVPGENLIRCIEPMKAQGKSSQHALLGGLVLSIPWAYDSDYTNVIAVANTTASGRIGGLLSMRDTCCSCIRCKQDDRKLKEVEELLESAETAENSAEHAKLMDRRHKELNKKPRSHSTTAKGKVFSKVKQPSSGRPKSDEFLWTKPKTNSSNTSSSRRTTIAGTTAPTTREAAIDALHGSRSNRSPRDEDKGQSKPRSARSMPGFKHPSSKK